jgi:hypothetical protein
MKKLIVLMAMATLVLTACASDSSDPAQESLPTAPSDGSSTTLPGNPELEPGDSLPPEGDVSQDLPDTGSEVDQMVEVAVADLADRLSVNTHAITVVTVESVTWRDGSMGCPEPGMSYTQALVNGIRVELTVDGISHWYHQGGSNPIKYCENPREPLEGSPDA